MDAACFRYSEAWSTDTRSSCVCSPVVVLDKSCACVLVTVFWLLCYDKGVLLVLFDRIRRLSFQLGRKPTHISLRCQCFWFFCASTACGSNAYYCTGGYRRTVSSGYYSTGGSTTTRTGQAGTMRACIALVSLLLLQLWCYSVRAKYEYMCSVGLGW